MNASSRTTYLNTAACGLIENEALQAANKFYTQLSNNGSNSSEEWKNDYQPRIRATIAAFLGADSANIALVPNFSWALNAVVQSLNGAERVLLYKHDYPSVLDPFRINNFPIQWIDDEDGFSLPIDQIRHCIRHNEIDMLAISHVQFNSGYKLDLEEIGQLCKQHGVVFMVDATQSLGAVPINVSTLHVDLLIASNYKWMNAGFGTGIMYMSDSFLAKYPPVVGGNNSYQLHNGVMSYLPSILSYEPGHPNIYGLTLLEAAIAHKQQSGIENIERHNSQLTALLLQELQKLPVKLIGPSNTDNRSAIILLQDLDGLSGWLKQNNMITTNRGGRIRISMHYYNTEADITQLASCLHQLCNR